MVQRPSYQLIIQNNVQTNSAEYTAVQATKAQIATLFWLIEAIDDRRVNNIFPKSIGQRIKQLELFIHKLYLTFHAEQDQHEMISCCSDLSRPTRCTRLLWQKVDQILETPITDITTFNSDNVATKTHFGNYTFIRNQWNATTLSYLTASLRDISLEKDTASCHQHVLVRKSSVTLQSYSGGFSRKRWLPPFFDCLAYLGEGEKLADAIDITGRLQVQRLWGWWQVTLHGADALGAIESIEELDQNRTDRALHQVQHVNTVCFRGAQYTNGKFTTTVRDIGVHPTLVCSCAWWCLMYMDPSKEPQKGDQIV